MSVIQKPLNICIVSRKKLDSNTRITRQARALRDAGHKVTVMAMTPPQEDVLNQSDGIDYEIVPWGTAGTKYEVFFNILRGDTVQNLKELKPEYLIPNVKKHMKNIREVFRKRLSVVGDILFFVLLGAMALVSAPIAVLALLILWPLCLLFFAISRVQMPKGATFKTNFKDVLKLNILALLREVISPYLGEVYRFVLRDRGLQLLKEKNFDIIQAHDSYALWPVSQMKKKCSSVKTVFDAVEVFKELSGRNFGNKPAWLMKYTYNRDIQIMTKEMDRIISFGPGAAEFMAEEYNLKKPDLIRNCRYFYPLEKKDTRIREDAGIKGNEKLVIILNTLYQGQGLEQVIEAMSYLDDSIHIATVGWDAEGGSYTDACLAEAKKRGVLDRLHLMGRRTTQDLIPYASGGDIGLMPRQHNGILNNWYSMPNRIFELIMARLPIAATSLPCIKDLIEKTGAGMVFDETKPKDIARVITEMLKPTVLKDLKNKTEQTARMLCWENESRSYVRIIENVAAGNTGYKQEFFTDAYDIDPEYLESVLKKLKLNISSDDQNKNLDIAKAA